MAKTSEKSELLEEIKAFERRGMAWVLSAAKDETRIISSLRKRLNGKGIEFEMMFKEVDGTPKFATFIFRQPSTASFIFFTYDSQGKPSINRKVFGRMYEFLVSGNLVPEFRDLIAAERFE